MDVGVFMRSKVHLGLWIGTPLALIIVLQVTVSAYTRHMESVLKESTELISVLPEMGAHLTSAQSLVSRFAVLPQGAMDASEVMRKRVADAEQASRFTVNSLSVGHDAPQAAAQPSAVRAESVSISGQGTLRALITFLNELQGGEALIAIVSAAARASEQGAEALYSADFVLDYYVVSP